MRPSPLLLTATRALLPLLLLASFALLWRGHNEPGGGFVGGLVAAAGLALHQFAHGAQATRALLRVAPRTVLATGLMVALTSALLGPLAGQPFMTGLWTRFAGLKLGTPLLFDVGVYLVVVGFTLTLMLVLEEPGQEGA